MPVSSCPAHTTLCCRPPPTGLFLLPHSHPPNPSCGNRSLQSSCGDPPQPPGSQRSLGWCGVDRRKELSACPFRCRQQEHSRLMSRLCGCVDASAWQPVAAKLCTVPCVCTGIAGAGTPGILGCADSSAPTWTCNCRRVTRLLAAGSRRASVQRLWSSGSQVGQGAEKQETHGPSGPSSPLGWLGGAPSLWGSADEETPICGQPPRDTATRESRARHASLSGSLTSPKRFPRKDGMGAAQSPQETPKPSPSAPVNMALLDRIYICKRD